LYEPCGQSWHDAEAATGLNLPEGHAWHSRDPVPAKEPFGHGRQADAEDEPVLALNVPVGHTWQGNEEPGSGLKDPVEQLVQVLAPAAKLYWPAGQSRQALCPLVAANWPGEQSLQVLHAK
jgi:hypothetical protein